MTDEEERSMRLKNLRGTMSAHYVAQTSKVASSTYYALEKGEKRGFKQDIFTKLARTLKTTPEYIMFGTRSKNSGTTDEPKKSFAFETERLAQIKMGLVETFLKIDDLQSLEKITFFVKDQQEKADLQKKYDQLVTSSVSKAEGKISSYVENHEEIPPKKRGRKKKTDTTAAQETLLKPQEEQEQEKIEDPVASAKEEKTSYPPIEKKEKKTQKKRGRKKKLNKNPL